MFVISLTQVPHWYYQQTDEGSKSSCSVDGTALTAKYRSGVLVEIHTFSKIEGSFFIFFFKS